MSKPKVRTVKRSVPPAPQSRNRILAALPRADFERLRSALSLVTLEQKHSLWEPGQLIEVVYFPLDFVASILAVTKEGLQVEVGTIGNEGLVGLPVFLGAKSSPGRAFVQVPGQGERLDVGVFLREALREGTLRDIMHR